MKYLRLIYPLLGFPPFLTAKLQISAPSVFPQGGWVISHLLSCSLLLSAIYGIYDYKPRKETATYRGLRSIVSNMQIYTVWRRFYHSTTDMRHSTTPEYPSENPDKDSKEYDLQLLESQTNHNAVASSKVRAIESMRTWKWRYFLYAGYVGMFHCVSDRSN